MTDPARPGNAPDAPAPEQPAHQLPDWRTFARTHDWGRAQAAAQLSRETESLAALSSLAALQSDIRARRYPAARRALGAYHEHLETQNDPLLRALVAPEGIEKALDALQAVMQEADASVMRQKLEPAMQHTLTKAEAHNALGVLHALHKETQQARQHFEEARRLDKDHYRARTNLGNLALEAGNPAEAEAEYREVLKIAPEYDGVYHNLGVALRRQGKIAESVSSIRRAQRLNIRQSKLETKEDMQEQFRTNPRMRLIRNVVLGLFALALLLMLFWR